MKTLPRELSDALHNERYDITDDGLYFPVQGVMVKGTYTHRVNGGDWTDDFNLITTEGMAHFLNVALGTTAKPAGYFLALFAGAVNPAANWTAGSFAATAAEVVSMTEGYTAANRPAWIPTATTTNTINNMTSTASVTIATASQLNVSGAALLTSNVRGGTTGVLVSACRYGAVRTFQAGDIYDIGYNISLTT